MSLFVLVATTESELRVKAISLPSGDQSYDQLPPRSIGGESASPGVMSLDAPPLAGRTKRCVRLPSFQEFQTRKGSLSKIFALDLLFSTSSARFLLLSSPGH